MASTKPASVFQYGSAQVSVYSSTLDSGEAAAAMAATLIRAAIETSGSARIIAATGNSQIDFINALVRRDEVPWDQVEVLHMDEYIGLPETHPASFRRWIKKRIQERVPAAQVRYLKADAEDLSAEIQRYSALLAQRPCDIAFVGFGENGHIAFNDPPTADFNDPAMVKIVELDEVCRSQQTGEGHFPTLQDVPTRALTLTCPALFNAAAWVSVVPERRKAQAVKMALEGPISTACPASIVRTHPHANVFLDRDSSCLLDTASIPRV